MIAQWPPQPTPQTLHRKDSQDKRELTPTADEVFNDVLFTWHCHCLLPHPPPHTHHPNSIHPAPPSLLQQHRDQPSHPYIHQRQRNDRCSGRIPQALVKHAARAVSE